MATYDPHKSTTEVRQGSRRKMNLRVLIVSTIVVVVLFAIILAIFNGMAPGTPSSGTTTEPPPVEGTPATPSPAVPVPATPTPAAPN